MEEMESHVRNISIYHESNGKMNRVLVNGEDLVNIIRHDPIKYNFDPFRPDAAEFIFPTKLEQVFPDIFFAIDDLFCSNKGCLAAFLSSFLYEKLTLL